MSSALLTAKKLAPFSKLKVLPSSSSSSFNSLQILIKHITTTTAEAIHYPPEYYNTYNHQNPQFQPNPNHQNTSFNQFQQYPNHFDSQNNPFNGSGYQQHQHSGSPNGYYEGLQQYPNGYQQTPSPNCTSNQPLQVPHGVYYIESSVNHGEELVETIESKGEFKKKEALQVLGLLEKQSISLDLVRYFQLMKVFGAPELLKEAKAVHNHLIRSVSNVGIGVYNKILEMYWNCGSVSDAYELFDRMPERNLTSWDTMIMGYSKNGLGEEAIDLFIRFKEGRLKPDGNMFLGVFFACGVLGDIHEGMLHFESMSKVYDISPSMEHYVSVVEMMGSTGYLDEALEFIEKMPVEPNVDVWEKLMNLSRVQGNKELGDYCAEMVEHLDPSRLTEQSKAGLVPVKASDIAKEKEKKSLSSKSLLDVKSRVHEYRAGDTSHPENDKIYALLRGMSQQMKEVGYVPQTRFVLHDVDQEDKETALLAHSEKLAVAHGLITSASRAPIRVIKNLRVCGDCHVAMKIISKLVGRQLIMRDAKRFHHFENGVCSCRDYW